MNKMLVFSGSLSCLAAFLHLGCIYFGAPWYRFFGAGEQMALMAEQGSIEPTIITLVIFTLLLSWALYAFSAAELIPKLPFTRIALIAIAAIYTMRGIVGFALINNPLGRTPEFWILSSLICLLFGIVHIVGIKQQWHRI